MYDLAQIERNFRKFPQFKADVMKAIASLDAENTYSNADCDRQGHLHSLLQSGSKVSLELVEANHYGKGQAPKFWMAR